jgi:hypothetical protein
MNRPVDFRIDDAGVTIVSGEKVLADLAWEKGHWSLWIVDAGRIATKGDDRPGSKPGAPTGYLASIDGRPCLTSSLDEKGRDADRKRLGLAPDPGADPILLTNSTLRGPLILHFGLWKAREAEIIDEAASRLIRETFGRGFEVRRLPALLKGRGGTWAVVTEVTNSPRGTGPLPEGPPAPPEPEPTPPAAPAAPPPPIVPPPGATHDFSAARTGTSLFRRAAWI